MLKLKQVSLTLEGYKIFSQLNFELQKGSAVAIIGPSGAGKTLFLKLSAGLIPPTTGSIYLFENDLTKLGMLQLQALRQKIGFSFQQSALFDFLSVRENIAFTLRHSLRWESEKIDKKVNFLLKATGLEDAKDKMPHELSGGMKKRVSLARALAHNPELLFCDDPTAGLDPITSSAIAHLIKELRQEFNFTLLLATNQLATIRRLVDDVYLLYRGRLEYIGKSKELEFQADKKWEFLLGE